MAQLVGKPGTPVASCGHPDCPPWKIKSKTGRTCPCCVIIDHIAEVKQIQSGVEDRGGVFASKQEYHDDAQSVSHKDWIQKWRRAKILCAEAVECLDKLNDENPTRAEEWCVTQALSMWQSAAEECGKVPGYSYVQEKPKHVAQEADMGDMMQQSRTCEDKSWSAHELQELWADDREYVIKPKRKSHKSRHTGSTISPTPKFNFSRTDDNTFNLKSQPPHRTETQAVDVDDDVLKEMEDVTNRLIHRLRMESYDSCNAFEDAGVEMIQIVENGNPLNFLLAPSPVPKAIEDTNMDQTFLTSSPSVRITEPPTKPAKATPRSALRGTRVLISSNLHIVTPCPPPRMKLNFSDHAVVFSDNDSPLTPETATQKPHNKHTDAESSRLRKLYQRTSKFYNASTAQWASPKGYEKMETSFNYKTWDYLDAANKREDKDMSTVKPAHSLNDVMSTKAASSRTDPKPSAPEFTAALIVLEDDLADAMLDEDNAVEQKETITTNEPRPKQGMQLILRPTASTSDSAKHSSHPLMDPLNVHPHLNKQLVLRPKHCELFIVHHAATSTSPRAPLRRPKRSLAPPESPAPKSRSRAESVLPVTELRSGGHCKQGGKVHCGLMFGVAERESER